jgi:D-tyrosyl-tRNA(Tyr) deacylase
VSQFTLYADCRRGRRPSFDAAEKPPRAEDLCRRFARALAVRGCPPEEGVFGAHMTVRIENDGPVTIWLDTAELSRPRRGG